MAFIYMIARLKSFPTSIILCSCSIVQLYMYTCNYMAASKASIYYSRCSFCVSCPFLVVCTNCIRKPLTSASVFICIVSNLMHTHKFEYAFYEICLSVVRSPWILHYSIVEFVCSSSGLDGQTWIHTDFSKSECHLHCMCSSGIFSDAHC